MIELEGIGGLSITPPEFELGDMLYHVASPDSGKGVILDATYSVSNKAWRYNISFGILTEQDLWVNPLELTKDKPLEL